MLKKIKKIIIIILIVALVCCSNSFLAYAYNSYISECESKIAPELKSLTNSNTDDELYSIAIWCEGADLSDIE